MKDAVTTGAGGEASVADAAVVCPECGRRSDEPWRVGWSRACVIGRRLRWAALVLVLGVVVVQSWRTAAVSFTGGGSGGWVQFAPVGGAFTIAELREIAEGRKDGAALARALCEHRPWHVNGWPWAGDIHQVRTKFSPRSGTRSETTSLGWPGEWYTRTVSTQYMDMFAESEVVPKDWGTITKVPAGNGWRWGATGTKTKSHVDERWEWEEIRASVLIWLGLSWVMAVVLALIAGLMRRKHGRITSGTRRSWYRPGWRMWVAALLVVAVGMGLMAARARPSVRLRSESVERMTSGMITVGTSRGIGDERYGRGSGLTFSGLHEVEGVRVFAAEAVYGMRGMPEDQVLEIGLFPKFVSGDHETVIGWPRPMLTWMRGYARPDPPRDLAGEGVYGLDARWRVDSGSASWPAMSWSAWSGDRIEYVTVRFYLTSIATLVLPVLGVWWMWSLVLVVIEWGVLKKRRKGGRCVACGYSLEGLRGTA